MGDLDSLMKRLQTELDAGARRVEEIRRRTTQVHEDRQGRLEQFARACEGLQKVWRPRLEAFASKFGDRVKVTPTVTPSQRDAVLQFHSELAAVKVAFSASPDVEKGNLVLDYELSIVPVLMDYERHARMETPLDRVDDAAVAAWIDDRLVSFVRAYNAMTENEFYLRGSMVEDPVAKVRFPKFVAAASLVRGGKTIYFVSADTKRQFEAREAPARKAEAPAPASAKPTAPAKASTSGPAASADPAEGTRRPER
jgi:YHS domain-containing protein